MLTYTQWKNSVTGDFAHGNRIGEDLILLKSTEPVQKKLGPFHADITIAIIITKGAFKININMTDYEATAPCMITILPKQIFKVVELPDNMMGDTIIMSNSLRKCVRMNDILSGTGTCGVCSYLATSP